MTRGATYIEKGWYWVISVADIISDQGLNALWTFCYLVIILITHLALLFAIYHLRKLFIFLSFQGLLQDQYWAALLTMNMLWIR